MKYILLFSFFIGGCDFLDPKSTQQLDFVGHFFQHANWQVVSATDTTYNLFAEEDEVIKVYRYKIENGDSVYTRVDSIWINDNDEVVWNIAGTKLKLIGTTPGSLKWSDGKAEYEFLKFNETTYLFDSPRGKVFFEKTLPIKELLISESADSSNQIP